MDTFIIRVLYYGTVFAVSFMAGRMIGKWLNRMNREDRIAQYKAMSIVRKDSGLDPIPPSSFSLWAWEVDTDLAHLKPSGE